MVYVREYSGLSLKVIVTDSLQSQEDSVAWQTVEEDSDLPSLETQPSDCIRLVT
jgi:hypothetical protein